jgi:hypothetical protein
VKLKYIKIFEDYSDDQKISSSETSHTWTDILDTVQMKKPFVIIVFKNKDAYASALSSEDIKEFDYIKQTAAFNEDGKLMKYPSIFFMLDRDMDYQPQIKKLFRKFKIKQVIFGRANSEYSTIYVEDGTSSDYGNEIVATNEPEDFSTEDHFKFGSHYYRFIDFPG